MVVRVNSCGLWLKKAPKKLFNQPPSVGVPESVGNIFTFTNNILSGQKKIGTYLLKVPKAKTKSFADYGRSDRQIMRRRP